MIKNLNKKFIKTRYVLVVLLLGSFFLSCFPVESNALEDFTTDSFIVDIKANENFTFDVTEKITVNFPSERHGIYRNIPYKNGEVTIKNIKAESDDYSVSTSAGRGTTQKVITIGSPDKYVVGKKEYTIKYTIVGFDDQNKKTDYYSIDLLPTAWDSPINTAKATLTMPKAVDWSKAQFYAGSYGYNDSTNKFTVTPESDKTILIEGSNLTAYEGATIKDLLPEGYWVGAKNYRWLYYPIIVFLVAIPVLLGVLWTLIGRDPKIIKTVEFYPPEGMTPSEVGYIIDGVVDNKDLTSLIMYFAGKGYLTIEEKENNHFILHKASSIDSREKEFAKGLFRAIFDGKNELDMKDIPSSFGDAFMDAKSLLKDNFTGANKLYTTKSLVGRGVACFLMILPQIAVVLASSFIIQKFFMAFITIPIMLLMAAGFIMTIIAFDKKESMARVNRILLNIFGILLMLLSLGVTEFIVVAIAKEKILGILLAISFVISLVFTMLMKARTKRNAENYGKLLGFKDFIKGAELEKLKLLVEENPSYFYDIMPYAYVFGLSDKWAKNFDKLAIANPDWYSGINAGMYFNPIVYSHIINSSSAAITDSIISSFDSGGGGFDSGGGGFSGGGFSGGGFGGGGGGSW